MFFLFFLLISIGINSADAGEISWACKVSKSSVSFEGKAYSVSQVLGMPNAWYNSEPGAYENAYIVGYLEKENNTISGDIVLEVEFCKTTNANRVLVCESYNPGSVKEILIMDESGKEKSVYTNSPSPISEKKRLLQVVFPSQNVSKVKIISVVESFEDWNEIDAIGLTYSATDVKISPDYINLGQGPNSKYSELSPMIQADGKRIWFVRESHPQNFGIRETPDDQDLWYSDLSEDGPWSGAIQAQKPINTTNYDMLISVSTDGNELIINGIFDENGDYERKGMSEIVKTKSGWSRPQAIEIDNFVNNSVYSDYCISNSKKHLLMSIQTDENQQDRDLYFSELDEGGNWTEPQKISMLNSAKDDVAPFLASDGRTLYFSSDREGGFGNNDIWKSSRLDDTWQKWTEPENLGHKINTPNWESYFSIAASGDYAYMVSYVDSYGEGDIVKIALGESERPDPVVLVYGKVLEAKSKNAVEAKITYIDEKSGKTMGTASSDPQNGDYKIILPGGTNYSFNAEAKGYYSITENIDASNLSSYQEIERNIMLKKLEVGQTILLKNIFFETGKTDLLESSFSELDRVVKMMSDNPDIIIEIAGHTDDVGNDKNNQKLSEGRAKSVVDYLTSQDANRDNLNYKGYGETNPVADNKTDEGRAKNRRVEFKIISN
jgi:outer membrane protein OmpA-like peptidoglycan-associated protein